MRLSRSTPLSSITRDGADCDSSEGASCRPSHRRTGSSLGGLVTCFFGKPCRNLPGFIDTLTGPIDTGVTGGVYS
jgi:hypothetical protein